MTVAELARLIGRLGVARLGGLEVRVTVRDVRTMFGRTDLLVVPVEGGGEKWVDAAKVALEGEDEE